MIFLGPFKEFSGSWYLQIMSKYLSVKYQVILKKYWHPSLVSGLRSQIPKTASPPLRISGYAPGDSTDMVPTISWSKKLTHLFSEQQTRSYDYGIEKI